MNSLRQDIDGKTYLGIIAHAILYTKAAKGSHGIHWRCYFSNIVTENLIIAQLFYISIFIGSFDSAVSSPAVTD